MSSDLSNSNNLGRKDALEPLVSSDMKDALAIDRYIRHLNLRGLSRTTRNNCISQLKMLAGFLGATPLLGATKGQLTAWAEHLADLKLTPRSRYAKISIAHCFYVWAYDEELITAIPTHKLPRPKLPKLLPRPVPLDSLERALVGAPQDIRAWLTLMAFAGLRCMEIATMTRDQIMDTLSQPMLLVHGKGGKDRIVPLNQRVMAELRACGLPHRGYIWLNRTRSGRPPTANRVSQLVNTWLHDAGIPDTAHSLRHWFATEVQDQSGDIQTTADLLGHADLSNVLVYTQFNNARAIAAVMALDNIKSGKRLSVVPESA